MNKPSRISSWDKVLIVSAIGIGLVLAYVNRFIQDDAFISFRYAYNLVHGYGLTWNPGEPPPVQGYTNFLWTLLMAIPLRFGMDVVQFSYGVSLLCTLGTLISTYYLANLFFRSPSRSALCVLLLGTNYTFSAYGTGGLETQLQAFLCTISLFLTLKVARSRPLDMSGLATISVLCALAGMTRQDSAISFFLMFSFLAWHIVKADSEISSHIKLKRIGAFSALLIPVGLIIGIWLLWNYRYYGDILPNTFYLKFGSGLFDVDILKEGFAYIYEFLLFYWLVPFGFLFVFFLRQFIADPEVRLLFFTIALRFLYVIKIGGDFMEFRFFVPIMPPMFISILWLTRSFQNRRFEAAMVSMILVGSIHNVKAHRDSGIATIRTLSDQLSEPKEGNFCGVGKKLGELFAEKRESVLISVAPAGAIPFYSTLPTIDQLGLNDKWVARHGAYLGTRAGHRKVSTHRYLVERGVNLVIGHPNVYEINKPVISPYPMSTLSEGFRMKEFEPDLLPQDAVMLEINVDARSKVLVLYMKRNSFIDEVIARNNITIHRISRQD